MHYYGAPNMSSGGIYARFKRRAKGEVFTSLVIIID